MMEVKCTCHFCLSSQYSVDIASFSQKRRCGVSGILRVKNDAEFLADSIESCIEALDELIIVYNDCTDQSPEIIKIKAKQYCNKIKYYEYKPKIYSNNLSEEEYKFIKSQPEDSPHLLANYYNFALSKVTYEFVMKIDADQIYLTSELKLLCDAYRCVDKVLINPIELLNFVYFYLGVLLYKKLGFMILFNKRYLFKQYRKCLLKFVSNYKIPIFLSGYNMFYHNKSWYVPLGKKNKETLNILPPYNGVTDHSIFRLSSKTYFVPIEMKEYTQLNSHRRSLIEVLCGVRFAFPYGFIWMHLNGMRRNIYIKQEENYIQNGDRYLLFNDFVKKKFCKIDCVLDTTILSQQNRLLYSVLHDVVDYKKMEKFVEKYYMDIDNNLISLKKRI